MENLKNFSEMFVASINLVSKLIDLMKAHRKREEPPNNNT